MENKSLKPKIRFKGFTEAWEQRKLTDFVEFFNGQTYSPADVQDNGTLVLRSSNVQNGEISREDSIFINNDVVNTSNVKIGDIIVVVRNGSRNLIGKHAQIKENMPNTVIGAFMTGIRTKNSSFVNSLLNTPIFEDEINKNMGATINQITGYMFSNMDFKIPNNVEQQKIGKLFETIDNLITLHQRKCDKLVNIKKSLLEKMFPKNGNNVPEIRFKGFTEAWEQRKLDEFGISTSGTSIESEFGEGEKYKVISIGSYSENSTYNDQGIRAKLSDKTKKRVLNKGDLTMILNDKTSSGRIIGRVLIIDKSDMYVFNQRTQRIEPYHDKYDAIFLYEMLNAPQIRNKIFKQSQGNTQIYVNWSTIKELEYLIPNIEEQIKLGHMFKQLDNLITLHQKKLNKLKNIKKSLLEKMFV